LGASACAAGQTVSTVSAAHYANLTPEQRKFVDSLSSPIARKLSPREVFDAGRRNLVRFRPEQTARLLIGVGQASSPAGSQAVPALAREVTVTPDHLIVFEDQNISPSPLRFLAHHFAPGDKFQAVINPWSPHTLHLFNSKGGWIGVVSAWQRIPHTDTAALHAQMGRAAAIEKQLLAPLAARGAAVTRQRLADAQHNIEVLGQTTRQSTARARQLKQLPGTAADFLEEPATLSPALSHPTDPTDPTDPSDDFSSEALL
jgi:hypothetical protein